MRYCSRCGFTLIGVALVLDNDGMIPQLPMAPDQKPRSSRNRIMLESAIFTVCSWAVALVATWWFDTHGAFETVAKIATLLFTILGLIGLLRFLYGFLFVRAMDQIASNALPTAPAERTIAGEPSRSALPPQQSIPVSDYPRRVNTKEMRPQPSVTENTTRLLDEQPK